MSDLTIAILAGGSSRRMGQDKASLVINDETLLERTVRVALTTNKPVLVVGRAEPENWFYESVEFIVDDYPECGPLGGLVTALRRTTSAVLLLACDMPNMSKEVLDWLIESLQHDGDRHGLICQHGEQLEPLFSIYSYSSLSLALDSLKQSVYSMRNFIAEGQFSYTIIPTEHVRALHNVNTPQDLD